MDVREFIQWGLNRKCFLRNHQRFLKMSDNLFCRAEMENNSRCSKTYYVGL